VRATSWGTIIFLITALLMSPLLLAADNDSFDIDVGIKTVVFFYNEVEGVRLSVDHGWTLGGEVILWFPAGFGVGAEIEYYTMGEDFSLMPGIDVSADYSQMPLCINGYYRFSRGGWGLRPYVGGGIAFVKTDVSTSTNAFGMTVNLDFSDTFTGWTAFGGLEMGHFYLEAQWLQVGSDLGIDPSLLGDNNHSEASGLSFWVGARF
jgi:opacity protein-like surface antigen